jgi:hypothetical protein
LEYSFYAGFKKSSGRIIRSQASESELVKKAPKRRIKTHDSAAASKWTAKAELPADFY